MSDTRSGPVKTNLASSTAVNGVTGTLPIVNGGTGQVTAQTAIDALLPAQGSASGKYLTSDGTNASWGSANAYSFIGSAKIVGSGSVVWTRTNTALGAFATTAAAPGPTVILNPGVGTIQTTDADLPRFTVNGLAAGTYKVQIDFFGYAGTSGQIFSYATFDGTTTGTPRQCFAPGAARGSFFSLVDFFSYGASGNKTFEVYGAASSGTVNIEADGTGISGGDVFFSIEKVG